MWLIGPQKHCFGLRCTVVGKPCLAYSDHCASIQTQVPQKFFFYSDPLTNEGGSWVLCPSHLAEIVVDHNQGGLHIWENIW